MVVRQHYSTNNLLINSCYRFLWLGVVVAAIAVFVGQVSERIVVYYQYKTNVAVTVNYVDRIDFPSVTICNQNNYRYVIM